MRLRRSVDIWASSRVARQQPQRSTSRSKEIFVKLNGEYVFEAPREEVWKALLDPEVLASILPGCDKLELVDGVY
ncbi:MAG: SRPBCC domain-containing protein, partial [Myxococcota bacterium]